VRVAVDVGAVRVGVAASDDRGSVAVPVTVLRRDSRQESDLEALTALVRERGAVEVVVGLPRTLSGHEGDAASAARGYAEALARRVQPVPVRLVDERLTTVSANRALREAGRDARAARPVVDAAAAVVLLESALATERGTAAPPGELVAVS
jgi:putative Holliday junction resolvase